MVGWILLAVAVVAIFWVVGLYNKLVGARNNYKNAFAQIDVQLTRRYDLIPNLVEIAKGYMKHERETLEAVIQARNSAISGLKAAAANPGDAGAMTALAGAEGALGATLGRLFALAEAYPDLKTDQTFLHLQSRISSLENAIADRREFYNESVNVNNVRIEQFPDSIVAALFSFRSMQLLKFSEQETADVDVRQLFQA